jgi:hypothetical protein
VAGGVANSDCGGWGGLSGGAIASCARHRVAMSINEANATNNLSVLPRMRPPNTEATTKAATNVSDDGYSVTTNP